jgi:hypothetical protein
MDEEMNTASVLLEMAKYVKDATKAKEITDMEGVDLQTNIMSASIENQKLKAMLRQNELLTAIAEALVTIADRH